MRLVFVVAETCAQRPTYGSVHLSLAALRLGHEVGFVGVDQLSLLPDGRVGALVAKPSLVPAPEDLCGFLSSGATPVTEEDLNTYDVAFLRYHPTREGQGGAVDPAFDFGLRLRQSGVLVVNDPSGVKRAGGRMYLSELPEEVRPRTLVTRDPARVKAFMRELGGPCVIKPLAEKSGGRQNVFQVSRGQIKNLNQIISVVRESGYIVAQEYLPAVAQGEKRLLLLAGAPISIAGQAAIYRRLPLPGGKMERKACGLGPAEERIVELLRPKLLVDGLYFVGLDIVGTKVVEINVYTPGGIHTSKSLYGIDVAEAIIRDLEKRVATRSIGRVA